MPAIWLVTGELPQSHLPMPAVLPSCSSHGVMSHWDGLTIHLTTRRAISCSCSTPAATLALVIVSAPSLCVAAIQPASTYSPDACCSRMEAFGRGRAARSTPFGVAVVSAAVVVEVEAHQR